MVVRDDLLSCFMIPRVSQLELSYFTRGRIQTPCRSSYSRPRSRSLISLVLDPSCIIFVDKLSTSQDSRRIACSPPLVLLVTAPLTPSHRLGGIVRRVSSKLAKRVLHAAAESIANALLEVLDVLQSQFDQYYHSPLTPAPRPNTTQKNVPVDQSLGPCSSPAAPYNSSYSLP